MEDRGPAVAFSVDFAATSGSTGVMNNLLIWSVFDENGGVELAYGSPILDGQKSRRGKKVPEMGFV